jgi:uncharacterized protein (DUF433 family)
MITEGVNYVEKVPDGGYRIVGSRVGLESVAFAYLDGQSPESIQDSFPSLSLEAIHGTIAFYLHHREEIDRYLQETAERYKEIRQKSEEQNAPLLARLRTERRNAAAH